MLKRGFGSSIYDDQHVTFFQYFGFLFSKPTLYTIQIPLHPTMPRVSKPTKPRHDPLHVDLEQDDSLRRFGRVSRPGRRKGNDGEDLEDGVSASNECRGGDADNG